MVAIKILNTDYINLILVSIYFCQIFNHTILIGRKFEYVNISRFAWYYLHNMCLIIRFGATKSFDSLPNYTESLENLVFWACVTGLYKIVSSYTSKWTINLFNSVIDQDHPIRKTVYPTEISRIILFTKTFLFLLVTVLA